MLKKLFLCCYILGLPVVGMANTFFCKFSDPELVYYIMHLSRESLSGYCDCPTDLDGFGNQCGDKSAYYNQLKYPVLCYPSEVTQKMMDKFKRDYCPSHKRNILGKKVVKQKSKYDDKSYSGNCLCPNDIDAAGRRCGKRSSSWRPGGVEPFCS